MEMRNLAFVIWIMGWPLAISIGHYFDCASRPAEACKPYGEAGLVILLFIWFFVAALTYDRRKG